MKTKSILNNAFFIAITSAVLTICSTFFISKHLISDYQKNTFVYDSFFKEIEQQQRSTITSALTMSESFNNFIQLKINCLHSQVFGYNFLNLETGKMETESSICLKSNQALFAFRSNTNNFGKLGYLLQQGPNYKFLYELMGKSKIYKDINSKFDQKISKISKQKSDVLYNIFITKHPYGTIALYHSQALNFIKSNKDSEATNKYKNYIKTISDLVANREKENQLIQEYFHHLNALHDTIQTVVIKKFNIT